MNRNEELRLIKEKTDEYRDYIREHINNVHKAFKLLKNYKSDTIGTYLLRNPQLLDDLEERINRHDRSKYSKEEFEGYRKNFFPINEEEKKSCKEEFDKAWEHHWQNNDHHWQARQDTETLNRPACWEMICDWMAMGMKFNDKCWEYYKENKNNIHMNEIETDYVETILDAIEQEDIENGYVPKEK